MFSWLSALVLRLKERNFMLVPALMAGVIMIASAFVIVDAQSLGLLSSNLANGPLLVSIVTATKVARGTPLVSSVLIGSCVACAMAVAFPVAGKEHETLLELTGVFGNGLIQIASSHMVNEMVLIAGGFAVAIELYLAHVLASGRFIKLSQQILVPLIVIPAVVLTGCVFGCLVAVMLWLPIGIRLVDVFKLHSHRFVWMVMLSAFYGDRWSFSEASSITIWRMLNGIPDFLWTLSMGAFSLCALIAGGILACGDPTRQGWRRRIKCRSSVGEAARRIDYQMSLKSPQEEPVNWKRAALGLSAFIILVGLQWVRPFDQAHLVAIQFALIAFVLLISPSASHLHLLTGNGTDVLFSLCGVILLEVINVERPMITHLFEWLSLQDTTRFGSIELISFLATLTGGNESGIESLTHLGLHDPHLCARAMGGIFIGTLIVPNTVGAIVFLATAKKYRLDFWPASFLRYGVCTAIGIMLVLSFVHWLF